MSRWSYAGMLLALFTSACAISEPPQPDRQTHWMERCDSDDDCGDFECACGVCTLSCVDAVACDMGGPLEAACVASGASPAAGLCGQGAPAGALCLPSCADDAACVAFGAGLRCVDAACVPEREPAAAVAIAQPLRVSCDALYRKQPLPGLEVLASGVLRGFAADESGVYWATDAAIMGLPTGAAQPVFLAPAVDVYHLAVEGGQLVWVENGFDEVRLNSVSLADAPVELARLASLDAFAFALALSADSVFWGVSGAVLRSPRTPGTPEVVVNDPALLSVPSNLMLDDSHLYYLRTNEDAEVEGGQSIVQFALDHAESRALVSGPIYVSAIDGGDLFYATTDLASVLQNAREDRTIERVRVQGDEPAQTVLTTSGVPAGLAPVGDSLYYWLAFVAAEDFVPDLRFELWRVRRDGDGDSEQLIVGDGFALSEAIPGLLVIDHQLYWLASCLEADRQSEFLLRVTLP